MYVSSTFQGNSGSITNKYTEWEDVTDNFSIPQEPVKGYGSMARAGSMKLDEFAVRIFILLSFMKGLLMG